MAVNVAALMMRSTKRTLSWSTRPTTDAPNPASIAAASM